MGLWRTPRQGNNPTESTLTIDNVSGLTLQWTATLHGAVIGQTLYEQNILVGGVETNLAYVGGKQQTRVGRRLAMRRCLIAAA